MMCKVPTTVLADYKRSLRVGEPGDAEYEAAKRACHLRSAERLVALCFANGGIYIKLGQHIGQLVRPSTPLSFHTPQHPQDHLLPDEYVHTMRQHLLDRCPLSDAHEVLQCWLSNMFACVQRCAPPGAPHHRGRPGSDSGNPVRDI